MINKNKAIDFVCGFLKKWKTTSGLTINFRQEFGTPEENSEDLIRIVTTEFDAIRGRGDPENLFIGRFMGLMLLIEAKLDNLLEKVDPELDGKMIGRKIDVFKDLLRELLRLDTGYDQEDVQMYRDLIGPLRELVGIRNHMAHDLRYIVFGLEDVPETLAYVRRRRPNWGDNVDDAPVEFKALMAVHFFGFLFCERLAFLEQVLD